VEFKRFKITQEDWRNREKWHDYQQAICDMVERTSTGEAPWTLVEANDKNYARVKILRTLCEHLEAAMQKQVKSDAAPADRPAKVKKAKTGKSDRNK
jgi:polyphosphate kinase 2 (PPK2 family)